MFKTLVLMLAITFATIGTQTVRGQDTAIWPKTEAGASCKLETMDFLRVLDSASDGIAKTSSELGELRDQLHQIDCDLGKLPKDVSDQMSQLCSDYFRHLGQALQKRGIQVGDEWTDGNLQANDIIRKMVEPHSQWVQITNADQAQQLANSGVIVEAVTHGKQHGHLATVSPAPPGMKPTVEKPNTPFGPPFVRDGNEHPWQVCMKGGLQRKLYPSSGGAVSAGIVFNRSPICSQGQAPNGCVGLYAWRPSWTAASSNLRSCEERKVEQAKTEPPKSEPAKVVPKGSGHTGLIILVLGGAAGAGVAAYELGTNLKNQSSSSSTSSGGSQLNGHCASTSPANACKACTCPAGQCNPSSQCGGDDCWTSSPTPPFC